MYELILLIISILPVFLLGMYIYKKDRNKEPCKLLIKLFIGGIASCFLFLFVSFLLELLFPLFSSEPEFLNLFELIIYVFIGIALVEESCKWVFSYKIAYYDNNFDEIYDMIVYSAFVALGFAFFENLFYVFESGFFVGILRAILAVPGHACDGVFMGYYLGLAKQSELYNKFELRNRYLICSILVPTLLHGIYDYCLFVGNLLFILLFLIFVVLLYIYSIKKINSFSKLKGKIKYNDNYCPNCGLKVETDFCPRCGRKNY